MKIKLLIVPDKCKQIILTPETPEETDILKIFNEPNIKIFKGCSFEVSKCQGGYYREFDNENSTIILLEKQLTPLSMGEK